MNPDAARPPGPHAGRRWRAMAFLGVPEQTIDQVFEHLGALHALPDRCLVFGSDMRLLGELVKQWRGVVEVVAIRVPRSALHLFDPVTPVVEAEGLTAAAMLWVCGDDGLRRLLPGCRVVGVPLPRDARVIAEEVAGALSPPA